MNISKDTYGTHLKAFGFKLSFIPRKDSGWSGFSNSFRIRFVNERLEFHKSYWILIGKATHSKVIKIPENHVASKNESYRAELQRRHDRQLKDGHRELK